MGYKLCSKCEINFIDDSENLCSECSGIKKTEKNNSLFASDYSQIRKGIVYGSNSRDIYEKFCNTLGWDYSQINKFGRQKPLYATNADTDRKRSVWFIFYANYSDKIETAVDDLHAVNMIHDNGNAIIEIVSDKLGSTKDKERVVFARVKDGYEFLGVYKVIQNGTTRIYERISDVYPLDR